MARFKLVIPTVLPAFQTGDELKQTLIAMNFKVAKIPKVANPVYPPKPTVPEDTDENRAIWAAWYIERNRISAELAAALANQKLIKANLISYLASIFKIAEYVVVGQNPDGTKKRDYRIVAVPSYGFTYSTCAGRLQSHLNDSIDFICYEYFLV